VSRLTASTLMLQPSDIGIDRFCHFVPAAVVARTGCR
jgi:hypothetical protein